MIRIIKLVGVTVGALTAVGSFAQALPVRTLAGTEIGGGFSHYQYEEPSLGVKLEGAKLGVDLQHTAGLDYNWYFRFEGRYQYGRTDYTGSGTKDNNKDWYYELRGLFGRDFSYDTYSWSPYIGLGFRHLDNNLRGFTTTGAIGYDRVSLYTYLPLGVTHRLRLQNGGRVSSTVEADWLIRGKQTSTLSDVDPAIADVTNDQRNGYGIRASIYYEKDRWSLGPWIQYWDINQSDAAPILATTGGTTFIIGTGWEPKNRTTEFGMRLGYRF